MTWVEQIRDRRRAKTFAPFAVLTENGKRYIVPERERVSFNPRYTFVVVYDYELGGFEIIGEDSIAGVESVADEEAAALLAQAS